MTLRSTLLLASALLAGSTGIAGAQTTTIYGGGSSLVAPYIRQSSDCWGENLSLATRAVAATTTLPDFNYTRTPTFDCSTQTVASGNAISYISTGSGRGILGFFSHTGNANPADWLGSPAPSGGTQPTGGFAASVQFGASDTAIAQAAVNGTTSVNGVSTAIVSTPGVDTYNNGGEIGVIVSGTNPSQTITRYVVRDASNTNGGQFANPRATYGAMIQIPLLVAPIVIGYDPVYKKVRNGDGTITEYRYDFDNPRGDGSGGLPLSRATLCSVFNGTITNWNQLPGVRRDPADPDTNFSVPLQIVGRADSSGTTSGWTRHLAAVCGGAYSNSTTTLPSSLRTNNATYNINNNNDPVANEQVGLYTLATGSEGVAKYLDFTRVPGSNAGDTLIQGRIGYLGSDYVLPYVLNTLANNYQLASANVANEAGFLVAPTPTTVNNAFAALLPPQSTSAGLYSAGAGGSRASAAAGTTNFLWVQASDKAAIIANPTSATTNSYYPIVTTSNFLLYTCYNGSAVTSAIRQYLNWFYSNSVVNNPTSGILARAGFAPVTPAYRRAILDTFVNDVATTAALRLRIEQAGTSPVAFGVTKDQCATATGA